MSNLDNPLIAALAPLTSRVRTDVTWTRSAAGEQRLRHREALTPERMAAHLNGGPARGVCPIQPGESVTLVGTIDLDAHARDDGSGNVVPPVPWPEMACWAYAICDAMALAWDVTPLVFRSTGGHGIHVHALFAHPQDAYSVRQWLRGILEAVGFTVGNRGVAARQAEVFPKQDAVAADKYGNQFILPLAGASRWLVPEEMAAMMVEAPRALDAGDWTLNAGVPRVERPVSVPGRAGDASWADDSPWRGALDALSTRPDYFADREPWRDVLFALHHESRGSEDGRALAHEWSQGLPKYEAEEVDKLWDGATLRDDGVTGGTIRALAARLVGWAEPIDASGFGPVDGDDMGVSLVVPADGDDGASGANGAGDRMALDLEANGPFELAGVPNFSRDRQGVIKPTVENTVAACEVSSCIGFRLAWDEFRDEITAAAPGTNNWRPLTDADVVEIRIALERLGFKSAGREVVRDAVVLVAARNRYDSARLWLKRQVRAWDGVRRVDSFLVRCFGCADTRYVRAVSRYIWTALAGRVLVPGCQVDMVPIFEGGQGVRKSSAVAALSPAPDFFVEVDLAENEETIVRKSRGTLVAEIAELSGLQTRQLEWVKKYVTRRTEKWVPKYKEFPSVFARRVVHFGTTNRDDVLADETGERRWLPMHVERADVETIEREREQLWAEGALMFLGELDAETVGVDRGAREGGSVRWSGGGVAWEDAERLAVLDNVHADFAASDSWEDAVARWLDGSGADDLRPGGRDGETEPGRPGAAGKRGDWPLAVAVVLSDALGVPVREQDMRAQKRVGAVLRGLGFTKRATRLGAWRGKIWHPPEG